jgi:type II secretory ATPase GspE/PulE/Tfp pilus assembly ATPase PilB-like protein
VDIEIRVSVLPGGYGESIVMRVLDPRSIKQKIEQLGLRPDLLNQIKAQLQKTTGAILTTGPTGSGKTTTLYAFIEHVNQPGVKIITIEDPIEYRVGGAVQTQVQPERGYTFANGLRSIVRQDPDVILVGEIRDVETAEIAMHAALTGHLVFSTIHTNDAAGTIPRLVDLGVKPQIIAPAINVAMAQRLVRKLCSQCKKKRKLGAEDAKKLQELLADIKQYNQGVSVPEFSADSEVFTVAGCEACHNTGYKGRIGVFEVFVVDRDIEQLILKSPAISEMRELAVKKGMLTLLQDGYLKVLEGVTDLAEVERVIGS